MSLLPPDYCEIIILGEFEDMTYPQIAEITDVPVDTHTVAPWFAGEIDYAPTVNDFSAEGFPLVDGRVDYLGQRKVAALVYLRRKHHINIFVSPNNGGRETIPVERRHNGFTIVGWGDTSFAYWAISDLNLKELLAFSRLITVE